jgi:SOS-response transcriptional repressor LexA
MGDELTDRQQRVLDYIRQSITENGYAPTHREIGAHVGIRSTNGVRDHLIALERKGYLTRGNAKSRALRPTTASMDRDETRPDFAAFAAALRAEVRWISEIHSGDRTGAAASDQAALERLAVDVEKLGRKLGFL